MAIGTLTLNALWIHDATNFSDSITVGVRSFVEKRVYEGETTRFTGGRIRAIVGPGKQRAYTITLKFVPRTTLEDLEVYMNKPIMLRDQRGRKMFGQIFGFAVKEELLPGPQTTVPIGAITFTFEEITMSEEV